MVTIIDKLNFSFENLFVVFFSLTKNLFLQKFILMKVYFFSYILMNLFTDYSCDITNNLYNNNITKISLTIDCFLH